MRISKPGLALFACSLLTACGSEPAEPAVESTETVVASTEDSAEPAMQSPVAAAAPGKSAGGDPIRGKGGLEERCLAKVAEITGAPVIGTNRIEESEAAIEIYVNVEGAQAPWKCFGSRDGTLGEVEYSGSEGNL